MKVQDKQNMTLFTVSSLEKIFPDQSVSVREPAYDHASMLLGERFSYQIVYCLEGDQIADCSVTVSGTLADHVLVRQTGLVPSLLPNYPDADDYVLRTQPGLYPDPLLPFSGTLRLLPSQPRSLWITVLPDCKLEAGTYEIIFTFTGSDKTVLGECCFTLERLPAVLPPQTLIHTEWFHADCIADYYGVPVFSQKHFDLIDKYMQAAAGYGVNMILTPLFTPPLDTAVGGERTTVQLVDVYAGKNGYTFSFDKLLRWIGLCDKNGIQYLEFSHLFTQWGAAHAPKIMAYNKPQDQVTPQDVPLKIFGWETESTSQQYQNFLEAFLPKLLELIHKEGLYDRCRFHVSDEPHKDHLPTYLACKKIVSNLTEGIPIMDAISDFDYYEQGIVDVPICSTDHIKPFLDHQVPNLWAYYCCGQYKEVANRFFCMPSLRNRILGIQLYCGKISGFLQWGFNFWNTAFSTRQVNPFQETDAGTYFPSGDAFLVYPGAEEPIGSIRGEILMEGLQDLRAMQLLESLTGRKAVEQLLGSNSDSPITFTKYPRENAWLLDIREQCNRKIVQLQDAYILHGKSILFQVSEEADI